MKKPYELHESEYQRMTQEGVGAWDQRPWANGERNAPAIDLSTRTSLENILKNSWAPRAGKVLELGCGTAPILRWVCSQGNFSGHGIDISKTAIDMAEAQSEGMPLTFEQADLCSLDNREAEYDLIIDGHCFHCLTSSGDRSHFLGNVHRMLNPGGVFVLMCMCGPVDMVTFQRDYPGQMLQDKLIYVPFRMPKPMRG